MGGKLHKKCALATSDPHFPANAFPPFHVQLQRTNKRRCCHQWQKVEPVRIGDLKPFPSISIANVVVTSSTRRDLFYRPSVVPHVNAMENMQMNAWKRVGICCSPPLHPPKAPIPLSLIELVICDKSQMALTTGNFLKSCPIKKLLGSA